MKNLLLLLVLFIAQLTFSQKVPVIMKHYTKKLTHNIKNTRNAVVIHYNYEAVSLTLGNNNAPSPDGLLNKVTEFLSSIGVEPIVLVHYGNTNIMANSDLVEIFKEEKIDIIIDISLTFFQRTFPFFEGEEMNYDGTLSKFIEYGFLYTIAISEFSNDDLMYIPESETFTLYAGDYVVIMNKLKDAVKKLKKAGAPQTNKLTHTNYIEGVNFKELPKNMMNKVVYVETMDEMYKIGTPKGKWSGVMNSEKNTERMNEYIKKQNDTLQIIYDKYDVDIRPYSAYRGLNSNIKKGFILLKFSTKQRLNEHFKDLKLSYNDNVELKVLSKFERSVFTENYTYFYLKDIATGNTYYLDYEPETYNNKDPYSIKSLEKYLALLEKNW